MEMNADKIYQKHLNDLIDDQGILSPSQLDNIEYQASLNALNELIELINNPSSNNYTIYSEIDPSEVETEDSGMSKIFHAGCEDYHDDNGMFVRIQSWDENKKHPQLSKFIGKRVRITIQEI